jgi:hypothetical protein
MGYEVISVKQMAAKRPSAEGVNLVSLPLFLITLVRNQKSLDIFKISRLSNIIVKVESYKSNSGLTQCYNCQRFGHTWVHCRQSPRCMWCGVVIAIENIQRRTPRVSQAAATVS